MHFKKNMLALSLCLMAGGAFADGTASNKETKGSNQVETLIQEIPSIALEAITTNLMAGINNSNKGVFLLCTKEFYGNQDLGLVNQEIHLDEFFGKGDGFLTAFIPSAFRYDPQRLSDCLNTQIKVIQYLPSMNVNKNIAKNVILIPVYRIEEPIKYLESWRGSPVIGVKIGASETDIQQGLNKALKPLLDTSNKDLEKIIVKILTGASK